MAKGIADPHRRGFDFFSAHNKPHFVFVVVLCAARRRRPRPADKRAAAKSAAVGASARVLQKLRGHEDSLLKSFAEFAGVPMRHAPRQARNRRKIGTTGNTPPSASLSARTGYQRQREQREQRKLANGQRGRVGGSDGGERSGGGWTGSSGGRRDRGS